MKVKIGIIIFGLLVFAQIMLYNYFKMEDIRNLQHATAVLEKRISEAQREKRTLSARHAELKQIINSSAHAMVGEFLDPESKFMEFLDYLAKSSLGNLEGEVAIPGQQQFLTKPIPLHRTGFHFKFTFEKNAEAEELFRYILVQRNYPIQVNRLTFNRIPGERTRVFLDASLMIPARVELPSLSPLKAEEKI